MQISFTFQFDSETTVEEAAEYFRQTLGIEMDEDTISALIFPGMVYVCPIERLPERKRFSIFKLFRNEKA